MYVPVTLSFTTLAYPEPGPKGFLWHKEDGIDWIPLLSNSDLQISSSGLHSNITSNAALTVTNEVGLYKQMIRLVKKGKLISHRKMSQYETHNTVRCRTVVLKSCLLSCTPNSALSCVALLRCRLT
jgi:hypothetical protein